MVGGAEKPEDLDEQGLRPLRVLFEHSPVPQFVADEQGALLLANPAYCAYVGVGTSQVFGSVPADVTHPDDLGDLIREGSRLLAGEVEVISVELRVRTADGSYRWCIATCSSAPMPNGVRLLVAQLLDIDDRRQAEQELAASQARFRGMADSVPVGIQQRDARGRLVYVNQRWTEVTGLSESDALGSDHIDLIHPDDRDQVLAASRRLAKGGAYHEQYRIQRPDGTVRWVSSRSAAVRGADGEIAGYVGSLEDITALLEAQENVNRLAAVAETTADLVGVVDAQGWVVWANEAARVAHGIAPETAQVHSTKLYTPESVDRFFERILPVLLEGERWSGELDMYTADGGVISIWQSLAPQLGADGELLSIAAVGRDLTDRKRREADLTHRATHDVLTGLPNRALLIDRIEHAVDVVRRSSTDQVALLFIDLDRFKLVNDELGHHAGDSLLRVVAERLAGALRSIDVVARLGGDEFVVLCPGLGRTEAEHVAQRLLEAVADSPIVLGGGRRVQVTASVGVTIAGGVDEQHAEGLLREADVAMYQAKTHGRNRYEVYDS